MTETSPATSSAGTTESQDVNTTHCSECAHPECRTRRAFHQPRLCGHTAEFAAEHRTAIAVQTRHPGVVIWFGEATQSYWAAAPGGLIEAADSDTLLLALWRDSHGATPTAEGVDSPESAGSSAPGVTADKAGAHEPAALDPIGGPIPLDGDHSGPLPVVTVDTAEAVLA
ncbi:hypothetical protein [Halostreptopolyspora alba]|uniref:hypothetical protein n=1 Tax=Halostreptopolyspora alba TaxID=2487137 RepID=UPI0011CE1EE7